MAARRIMNRLYYFTIEDESILAEAFSQLEKDVYAITYKVAGTEDVFVTTSETKDAMDRNDIPYNLLAEEDGSRIAVWHSPLSREELGDYEDAVRALALAYRAIAVACVGVNGEANLGFDLSVYDMFGPLAVGGCLVVPDHDQRGMPSHWAELIARHGIDAPTASK